MLSEYPIIGIRPVTHADLEDLYRLATQATVGVSTLTRDKSLLAKKIDRAVCSFKQRVTTPTDELYLFVLEVYAPKTVVIGVAAIESQVGSQLPFYCFETRLGYTLQGVRSEAHDVLVPLQAQVPASELCTLYLDPAYRLLGVGRFLSLSRFVFMATHRERFRDHVIAELRGVSSPDGRCPFWDDVMKPFFKRTFQEADLAAQQGREFIDECMPTSPLYIQLLSAQAQACLGQVHPFTKGAESILLSEGFHKMNRIDLFDAGPKYRAAVTDIRTIKRVTSCRGVQIQADQQGGHPYIIASGFNDEFRAVYVMGTENKKGCLIGHGTAIQLAGVDPTCAHSYARLYPKGRRSGRVPVPVLDRGVIKKPALFLTVFAKWYETYTRAARTHSYRP